MATESTAAQELIDQRLDAIDRALLGLLPRSERLAIVADVEIRVHEARQASPELATTPPPLENLHHVAAGAPRTRRQRSRTALTAGVLGIVSVALLFFLPITFLVAGFTGEVLGELAVYSMLGINIVVVALGGAAAVFLGIAALARLSRRDQNQVGHGWAITGLCTGPLPMLAGGLGTLTIVLPMFATVTMQTHCEPVPVYADAQVYAPPGEPLVLPIGPQPPTAMPGLPPGLVPSTPATVSTSLTPAAPVAPLAPTLEARLPTIELQPGPMIKPAPASTPPTSPLPSDAPPTPAPAAAPSPLPVSAPQP